MLYSHTIKLVRYYSGADGLKTGYTKEAGYCLTATATKNNMRLITVVMNEPDSNTRSSETVSLLDYGFSTYYLDSVVSKDTVLDNVKVELGDIEYVDIVPKEDVNLLNNKNQTSTNVDYEYQVNSIKAPVQVGDKIGQLDVIIEGKKVSTIDLTVSEDVSKVNIIKAYARSLKNILSGTI